MSPVQCWRVSYVPSSMLEGELCPQFNVGGWEVQLGSRTHDFELVPAYRK